jgi:hypothetical protein
VLLSTKLAPWKLGPRVAGALEAVVGVVTAAVGAAVADAKAAGVAMVAAVAAAEEAAATVVSEAPMVLAHVAVVAVVAAVAGMAAVVAIATERRPHLLKRLFREPFAFSLARYCGLRCFLGLPANALSNSALGNRRNSLATSPICHGMTR